MKKNNILFTATFLLLTLLIVSCKNRNVYEKMPAGKDLDVAYEKLLKHNKLEKDSTESFYAIGAGFVIYPDDQVEQNQASVYMIVSSNDKGAFKYLYNMTTGKFDSYKINSVDSLGTEFAHQIFPSFAALDMLRDSLSNDEDMGDPQIANIRFYINRTLNTPEIETMLEDAEDPGNSKIIVSDLNGNRLR